MCLYQMNIYIYVNCQWAHLQPSHWVDESDENDGQTEGQYNDGKETERSVASSEAPDIAIDIPALHGMHVVFVFA